MVLLFYEKKIHSVNLSPLVIQLCTVVYLFVVRNAISRYFESVWLRRGRL